MLAQSKHLEDIIANHGRTADVQVVFLDIEKYSRRRTLNQIAVIDAFTKHLRAALDETSAKYIKYAQLNELNFATDIIRLPTGDGAALVFSFTGLPDIHLAFSRFLLKFVHDNNLTQICEKFQSQGWCHCHDNYHLRVGISQGKCIVYRDVNDSYNVAGDAINMASRVMGLADRNQILCTEDAYKQLIDLAEDVTIADYFAEYRDVEVKHGVRINVYQYYGQNEGYVSHEVPEKIGMYQSLADMKREFTSIGLKMPSFDGATEAQIGKMLQKIMGSYLNMAKELDQLATDPSGSPQAAMSGAILKAMSLPPERDAGGKSGT